MKVFCLTLALLFLMLSAVLVNRLYINEVFDTVSHLLDAMPAPSSPDCHEQTLALIDYWEAQVDLVSLTVPFATVDRVSEQAATLSACAECGDVFGFQTALALLRDAIGDVRRLEQLSIENIL